MSAIVVFFLAAMACLIFSVRRRNWPTRGATPPSGVPHVFGGVRLHRRRGHDDVAMPVLVRQLAALLASGHGGPAVWGALAEVLAAEYGTAGHKMDQQEASDHPKGLAFTLRQPEETHPTVRLVLAVERASLLGLPAATAVRASCRVGGVRIRPPVRHAPIGQLSDAQVQTWQELAACFEVSEASGAPVAAVLSRLADRLEAQDDAAAMRETALAGPRATVRLLTWLPVVGLGLGMIMGVDPLRILLGSPVGWVCLGAGIALLVAGRWWANRLIVAAASPHSKGGSPRAGRRRRSACTASSRAM